MFQNICKTHTSKGDELAPDETGRASIVSITIRLNAENLSLGRLGVCDGIRPTPARGGKGGNKRTFSVRVTRVLKRRGGIRRSMGSNNVQRRCDV